MKFGHKSLTLLLFVLLSFLVYFQTLGVTFLSDDYVWLYDAKNSRGLDVLVNYVDANGFFYRPTTKLFFYIAYNLFGLAPLPYHAISIIMHGIVGYLVYVLSRRILCLKEDVKISNWLSVVIGCLFIVHPIHTEVVVWVSAITELIPSLIMLLVILLCLNSRSWQRDVSLWLLYFIAMGGHEFSITLPVIVFFWRILFSDPRKKWWSQFKDLWRVESRLFVGFFAVGIIYILLRMIAQAHWQGGDYSYSLVKLPFNIVGNSLSYVFFSIIGPFFYQAYELSRGFLRELWWIAASLIGLTGISLWRLRNYVNSQIVILSIIYLLGLLAFLPLGTIAERYVYFSSWLVYVGVVWGVWKLAELIWKGNAIRREFLGIAFFMISGSVVLTYLQFQQWHEASAEVKALEGYFVTQCSSFEDGDVISVQSPMNRVGRAWIFQVGVEEAASLWCDKNLQIIRQ